MATVKQFPALVNDAVRRQLQHARLTEWIAEGPPPDEAEVQRIVDSWPTSAG